MDSPPNACSKPQFLLGVGESNSRGVSLFGLGGPQRLEVLEALDFLLQQQKLLVRKDDERLFAVVLQDIGV